MLLITITPNERTIRKTEGHKRRMTYSANLLQVTYDTNMLCSMLNIVCTTVYTASITKSTRIHVEF